MKRHFFYTVSSIFTLTALITLGGIVGIIPIKDQYLWPLVTSLLLELAAAVVAAFRTADFFSEEKNVALHQSQAEQIDAQEETIFALTNQSAGEQRQSDEFRAKVLKRLQEIDQRLLVPRKPSQPIPSGPAPGSARTL